MAGGLEDEPGEGRAQLKPRAALREFGLVMDEMDIMDESLLGKSCGA